jgi:thiol-disulfide isomerase/thioredoxin
MRVTVLLAGLIFVVGCQKTNPVPSSTAGQAKDEFTADARANSEPDYNSAKEEANLLARLANDPQDARVLLGLARINHVNARDTRDDDHKMAKKAADYLRRALEADPATVKDFTFEFIGKLIFVNEARAFSQEKNDEASLKALRQAIDAGWNDIKELQSDPALAHVRQNPGFASIEAAIQAAHKKAVADRVDRLFTGKHNFNFDFDLKDTEGQPLTKQQYAGKLLMVNIWGTWCISCRHEIPDLIAATKKYKDQGFEIVGLNVENATRDAAIELIKTSMKHFEINYPCALSDEQTLSQIPSLNGVPTSIFFNRHGEIQVVLAGMISRETLEAIIERQLVESPAETKVPNAATQN